MPYLIMALLLLVKPEGLFGTFRRGESDDLAPHCGAQSRPLRWQLLPSGALDTYISRYRDVEKLAALGIIVLLRAGQVPVRTRDVSSNRRLLQPVLSGRWFGSTDTCGDSDAGIAVQ
jgi:hypothetical protein